MKDPAPSSPSAKPSGEFRCSRKTPWNCSSRPRRNSADMTADSARQASAAAIRAPNQLVVTFPAKYNFGKTVCEAPTRPSNWRRLWRIGRQPDSADVRVVRRTRSAADGIGGPEPWLHRRSNARRNCGKTRWSAGPRNCSTPVPCSEKSAIGSERDLAHFSHKAA